MPALGACLLLLAFSLYDLGTLSASVPRWIVIYGWASLGMCWLAVMVRRGRIAIDAVDLSAFLVWLYAGLSLLWSGDWREGVYEYANMTALFVVFLTVRRGFLVGRLGEAALLCVVVALIDQLIWPMDWGGFGNRNFQAEAMILALALSWSAKWLRPVWCVVCIATMVYLAGWNPSREWYFVSMTIFIAACGRSAFVSRRSSSSLRS